MIAKVMFTYEGRARLEKLAAEGTDEELAHAYRVVAKIAGSDVEMPAREELKKGWTWPGYGAEIYIDLQTEGEALLAIGVTFEIKRLKGTTVLPMCGPEPDAKVVNTYVQVPHIGLLSITEVKVETDYCTDSLQEDLNRGWMLLCVCPPNAARRPDYILGRRREP